MIAEHLPPDVYRYERKFLLDELDRAQAEMLIRTHPVFFRELYPARFNNNIYFDTPGLDFYRHNVEGYAERIKVRVRWYGDFYGEIAKPVLEFKVKSGLVGRKPSFNLQPFTFTPDTSAEEMTTLLRDPVIPEGLRLELKSLQPALINRYRRQYFMSADGRYRLTLDTEPSFYTVPLQKGQLPKRVIFKERVIIEVKFIQQNEKEIDTISSHFPFRMTKSSKYVDGVDSLEMAVLF